MTNEDATKAARDPKKAREAFASQGRVTSYYRRYETDRIFSPAIFLANQVILYETRAGASASLDYWVAEREADGFQRITFNTTLPADRLVALRIPVEEDFVGYSLLMQKGQYVISVQTVAYIGSSGQLTTLESYGRKALDRYALFIK